MSPFQGQLRRNLAARQFVNSFNSLLRRLRPTSNCGATPQPRCKNSINSNLRRERPERAASPQPRATPWVSAYKRPRPVRAKVWANGWLLLLPFQGVGNGTMVPRALPRALDLLGFQPAQGRRQGFLRTIPIRLIFQFSPPHNAKGATHRAVYGSFCFDFSKEVYNRVNYISIKEVQRIT